MKMYWTRKSIPELADLTAARRSKNYKAALRAMTIHSEFWAGAAMALIWMVFASKVNHLFFPGQAGFFHDFLSTVCILYPAFLIWNQFTVYGMRKHYRHILEQGKNESFESDAEKWIFAADAAEYQQWKRIRRVIIILLVVSGLILMNW